MHGIIAAAAASMLARVVSLFSKILGEDGSALLAEDGTHILEG